MCGITYEKSNYHFYCPYRWFYLAYNYNGIVESIGGLIIFMAGGYAGYCDGFENGKRYMLTGKKK